MLYSLLVSVKHLYINVFNQSYSPYSQIKYPYVLMFERLEKTGIELICEEIN